MTHLHTRDVMTTEPVTVRQSDMLKTARDTMRAHNCRRLPVLDDLGKVCGIITDRDVRLALNSPLIMRERWQDDMLLEHTEVGTCMSPDPLIISPDTPVTQAIELLLTHKINGIPVVENDQLVGIITVTDLLKALQTMLD